jgi:hypothetical protein
LYSFSFYGASKTVKPLSIFNEENIITHRCHLQKWFAAMKTKCPALTSIYIRNQTFNILLRFGC